MWTLKANKSSILSRSGIILHMLLAFLIEINAQPKNVLVLHSYNSGLSWTDEINKGIFDSFKDEYPDKVNLHAEFLDTKRFQYPEYFSSYKEYLLRKYQNVQIEVIISSDNAAFNLLIKNRKELFPNVPVVFCGLNYVDTIPEGFTGIMEDIDFKSNLETILDLHPNYNKLYIINDRSLTGQSIQQHLEEEISKSFSALRHEYLSSYTMEELQNKLSGLKKNDVVILLSFTVDRNGNYFSYDVLLEYLTPYCQVPIYGVWDFFSGKGIVGGKITNPYPHGVLASLMAKKILNGTPVNSIRVDTAPLHHIYDYTQLKKHHIKRNLLPQDATLINRPLDFLRKNSDFYIMLALIIVLLLLCILFLGWRIRYTSKSLKKEKALLKALENKSEALKKALQKANESNELKKKFIENISHEIRTPLNGIMGFSSLLNNNNDANTQKNYINHIHNCGNQLTNIIDNILTISLIDSKEIMVKKSTISLNHLLKSLYETYAVISGNNITLKLDGTWLSDKDDLIVTDEIKLTQILSNLLNNSFKFTSKGVVSLGYNYNDKELIFYVKDEGMGISKENQNLIFEKFRKVSNNKSELFRGTGLGLAICKAYVEMLGGTISVESKINEGTLIRFTLPLVRPNK